MFEDLLNSGPGPAETLAILAAGIFFLTALVTGVWKWRQMMTSEDHQAHYYVDTAHRASLLYSFAALLLMHFAALSEFSDNVNLVATALPLFYFTVAIGTYILHGFARDTENQFAERNFITTWGMVLLIVGEIGGFVVLFIGVLKALF